jgi:hypothetical protein
MTTHDEDVAEILQAEDEAMQIAEAHMWQFSPLHNLPDSVALRLLADYRKVLSGRGHSRSETANMIRSDLATVTQKLRGMTASMLYLGSARHAVLLHVALLVGIESVQNMPGLWEALRAKNFEGASEALMMSQWPAMVGTEEEEKRRVIDLARLMRTGVVSTEWSMRTH